jgi:hypothetical protein
MLGAPLELGRILGDVLGELVGATGDPVRVVSNTQEGASKIEHLLRSPK